MARNLTARLARLERRLPAEGDTWVPTPAEAATVIANALHRLGGFDFADAGWIDRLQAAAQTGSASECTEAIHEFAAWFVAGGRCDVLPQWGVGTIGRMCLATLPGSQL